MSAVAKLAENAIRVYPMLYPNRLRFLQTAFSRYGSNYEIDRETGDMKSRDGIRDTDQYVPDVNEASNDSAGTVRRRDAMIAQWTSENAAAIAEHSIHDDLVSLTELAWPTYGFMGEEVPLEAMSKDTRDAFWEVLYAYEEAYSMAKSRETDRSMQSYCTGKSWNLAWNHQVEIFENAMKLLERFTGKTREQRMAEQTETMNSIIAEMKAEGTW
jgi:hypothetical protein